MQSDFHKVGMVDGVAKVIRSKNFVDKKFREHNSTVGQNWVLLVGMACSAVMVFKTETAVFG